MSKKPFTRRGSGDSYEHEGGDLDLEQRNRETIKSNAERQAQQKLETSKYNPVLFGTFAYNCDLFYSCVEAKIWSYFKLFAQTSTLMAQSTMIRRFTARRSRLKPKIICILKRQVQIQLVFSSISWRI